MNAESLIDKIHELPLYSGCASESYVKRRDVIDVIRQHFPSEIPVNEQYVVVKVGPHRKMLRNSMDDTYTMKVERQGDTAAFTIMRQYPEGPFYKKPETFCFAANCETHLPATEPVPVNLALCVNAALAAQVPLKDKDSPIEVYRYIAKAVLDTAGVIYVD